MELKQYQGDQSTDRMVGVGNRLITAIEQNSKSQDSHQKAIYWLTLVIAISTVVYTGVTVWSVFLQRDQLSLERVGSTVDLNTKEISREK